MQILKPDNFYDKGHEQAYKNICDAVENDCESIGEWLNTQDENTLSVLELGTYYYCLTSALHVSTSISELLIMSTFNTIKMKTEGITFNLYYSLNDITKNKFFRNVKILKVEIIGEGKIFVNHVNYDESGIGLPTEVKQGE